MDEMFKKVCLHGCAGAAAAHVLEPCVHVYLHVHMHTHSSSSTTPAVSKDSTPVMSVEPIRRMSDMSWSAERPPQCPADPSRPKPPAPLPPGVAAPSRMLRPPRSRCTGWAWLQAEIDMKQCMLIRRVEEEWNVQMAAPQVTRVCSKEHMSDVREVWSEIPGIRADSIEEQQGWHRTQVGSMGAYLWYEAIRCMQWKYFTSELTSILTHGHGTAHAGKQAALMQPLSPVGCRGHSAPNGPGTEAIAPAHTCRHASSVAPATIAWPSMALTWHCRLSRRATTWAGA
eukprot:1147659-Pelagomonas_calceolata.AAC.3